MLCSAFRVIEYEADACLFKMFVNRHKMFIATHKMLPHWGRIISVYHIYKHVILFGLIANTSGRNFFAKPP